MTYAHFVQDCKYSLLQCANDVHILKIFNSQNIVNFNFIFYEINKIVRKIIR